MRGRYANCELENSNAETFAAIEVAIIVHYTRHNSSHALTPFIIPGLLVVGKGVKPSSSISAGLKGMRFTQQLQSRAVNLTTNTLNPPLNDLEFADELKETGFNTAVISAMSSDGSVHRLPGSHTVPAVMSFEVAAENASLLSKSLQKASPLVFYKAGDTLEQVLGQFVSRRMLNPDWLPHNGYGDIGFG